MEFIQTVVDQMEDAAVLIGKPEVRQVRIGFILVDNACELWLREKAMWLAASNVWGSGPDAENRRMAAQQPVERFFGEKLKVVGRSHPELRTQLTVLGICHDMRNELYHGGLVRPEILLPLASAFFHGVVDLLGAFRPPMVRFHDYNSEATWLAKYGVNDVMSVTQPHEMAKIISALRSRVSPAMPALVGALASYVTTRVAKVLSSLDFLAENGSGIQDQAAALHHVQFYVALQKEQFPEVVAARGKRAIFKAIDDARAAFRPDVQMGKVRGWATRGAALAKQTDEHGLIKAWNDIERELRPIEDLVFDAEAALDAHLDDLRH